MMAHDTIVSQELLASIRMQLGWYTELRDTVQKILGKMALSRGDLNTVMALFKVKQALMDRIHDERIRTHDIVNEWQLRKNEMDRNGIAQDINATLDQMEKTIRSFLDGEEQLKKYLERIMRKGD